MLAGLISNPASITIGLATFDGVASGATLSNGNLTVTHTAGVGGGRSTAQKNSGKYYFEVTLTVINGNNSCVGILTSAGTYTNLVTNGTNAAILYLNVGTIFSNDAPSGR